MILKNFVLYKNHYLNNLNHAIYAPNKSALDSVIDGACDGQVTFSSAYNFMRDRGTLNVPMSIDEVSECNYGYFQDLSGGNTKRYYFHILEKTYLNDRVCQIALLLDPLQMFSYAGSGLETYLGVGKIERVAMNKTAFEFNKSLIMKNSDVIHAGNMVNVHTDFYDFGMNDDIFSNAWVVFQTSVDLTAKWGSDSAPLMKTSKGNIYDNIASPVDLYVASYDGYLQITEYMTDYPWISRNITSNFIIPKDLINDDDLTAVTLNGGAVTGAVFKFIKKKGSNNFDIPISYTISDVATEFGFDEAHPFLMRGEYAKILVTNYQGSQIEVEPQLLSTEDGLKLHVQDVVGYENSFKVYPVNYNASGDSSAGGVGRGDFLNNSVSFDGFDSTPVLIDNYKLSFAQGAYGRAYDQSQLLSSQFKNVIGQGGQGQDTSVLGRVMSGASAVMGFVSGGLKGGISSLAGKFNDEYTYYRKLKATQNDNRINSPSVSEMQRSNAFGVANNTYGITIKFLAITDVNRLSVIRYYQEFGFELAMTTTLGASNFYGNKYYSYIRGDFSNCRVPNMEVELNELIKGRLQIGVKFFDSSKVLEHGSLNVDPNLNTMRD